MMLTPDMLLISHVHRLMRDCLFSVELHLVVVNLKYSDLEIIYFI